MATLIRHTSDPSYLISSLRRGPLHLSHIYHHKLSITRLDRASRHSSTMARTYESALSHLAALQSNRAVTSLFSPPADASVPKRDLNALAIPEMLAWLRRAGLSQDELAANLRCIHVAGTKGKGSVCAYLTALLTRGDEGTRRVAGKVGTYTSPHLVSVRERIAIDGAPISRALFARYFYEVWDACTEAARAELASRPTGEGAEISEEIQGPSTKPFYFRFLTIVALRAFLGEGVRSAVIECGIGGEYDSTNVLPATCVTASVVTQLGIDHVGMLGRTLPEIAWHKAGVCKPGRKCFTRRLEGTGTAEKTAQVLRQRAQEKGATLVEVADKDVEKWGGVKASEKGAAGSLEGEFQKYNQALAVGAAREHLHVLASEYPSERMLGADVTAPEKLEYVPSSFTSALQYARLRGRCETREDEHAPITWLIDGAHTAESLTEVARWFCNKTSQAAHKGNPILLFNQQDRDAAELVSGLLEDLKANAPGPTGAPSFAHAIFSRNDLRPRESGEPERDLSVQNAAAEALRANNGITSTSIRDNVADAVAEARTLATRDSDGDRTTVLVTGSLHLVGAVLRTLEPDAED
ncbi:FolC bifunctional protein [Xylaria bambusicola]|uniref:FolC bifunctional protein n=1 Tax=Xylaria bambusicola TaxID=326684 RepID=UPI0020078DBC|nr:FolC bifunctional protein [Xylaria bambusicola]KAI0505788.1 FolC bifunctional protein [Xylaria bambusicola]